MSDKTGDILLIVGFFAAAYGWLKLRMLPKGRVELGPITMIGDDGKVYHMPPQPAPVPQPSAPFSPSLVSDFFMPSMSPNVQAAQPPRVGSFGWSNFDEFSAKATDLDVFARTLFGEAAGEGRRGIEAVAAVIMNRVADRRFPNSARAVCLAPSQFSMWNPSYRNSDPNSLRALSITDSNSTFKTCLEVASDALSGRLKDPTGGAHHYYAPKVVTPPWAASAKSSVTIGNHIFLVGVP